MPRWMVNPGWGFVSRIASDRWPAVSGQVDDDCSPTGHPPPFVDGRWGLWSIYTYPSVNAMLTRLNWEPLAFRLLMFYNHYGLVATPMTLVRYQVASCTNASRKICGLPHPTIIVWLSPLFFFRHTVRNWKWLSNASRVCLPLSVLGSVCQYVQCVRLSVGHIYDCIMFPIHICVSAFCIHMSVCTVACMSVCMYSV